MEEDLHCPDCGDQMFENRLGGLTCPNKKCGRVIFAAVPAKMHLTALHAMKAAERVMETQEQMINAQKHVIELHEQRIRELEKKLGI